MPRRIPTDSPPSPRDGCSQMTGRWARKTRIADTVAHAESRMRNTEIRILRLREAAACSCVSFESLSVARLRVDDVRCKRLEMKHKICEHQVVGSMDLLGALKQIEPFEVVQRGAHTTVHDRFRGQAIVGILHCITAIRRSRPLLSGTSNVYSVRAGSKISFLQTKAWKPPPTQSQVSLLAVSANRRLKARKATSQRGVPIMEPLEQQHAASWPQKQPSVTGAEVERRHG